MVKPSPRIPVCLEENLITQEFRRLRAQGRKLCDLAISNPTEVNLDYPNEGLDEVMAQVKSFPYKPDPKGSLRARETIIEHMAPEHDPAHVWVTSSSSESYAYLFKLLCASGDEVLVPTPSYPLIESLLKLEGVVGRPFPLEFDDAWYINFDRLKDQLGPKTKAILMVHPNNPTGNYVSAQEQIALFSLCEERGLALIVDEVFLAFALRGEPEPSLLASSSKSFPLFVLGGMSKQFGLPQLKLSWIMAQADPPLIRGLDWIADHYLSVSTPLLNALPKLWKMGELMTDRIGQRVRQNFGELHRAFHPHSETRVLEPQAGWNAMVRLPSRIEEEDFVLSALRNYGVSVFPGFYFDLPFSSAMVVSLLPEPATFKAGISQLVEAVS